MLDFPKNQKGFAAFYLTVLILGVFITIGGAMGIFILRQQKMLKNTIDSARAYVAAEGGIEDALVRLNKGIGWSSPYSLGVGGASVDVDISDLFGGSRTITSKANVFSRIRKARAVYELSSSEAEFFYGAQVGEGGLVMENNSTVNGNIFSDGNINGADGTQIAGTIIVAGSGNSVNQVNVTGDAYADICSSATIGGVLYGSTESGCDYGSFILGEPADPIPLPIPQSDIDQWKTAAQNGGVLGSQQFSSGINVLGPVKIAGDLVVQNTATLLVAGTIWVTGNITVSNSARVRLDASYGSLSGQIVGDGTITLQNSTISSGTGSPGSYLMYLSTSSLNPSLIVKNFSKADIVYTSAGWIEVQNNTILRQITGYGVRLKNATAITYEIGLASVAFTSGPGASWRVTDWAEIE